MFSRICLLATGALLASYAGISRAELASDPVSVHARYTGEVLSNLAGGLRQDTAYVDNFDLTARLDPAKLWGWDGSERFIYGLYNNGTPFSDTIVGDFQVVSNIETGVQAVRLYEAWFRFRLGQRSEWLVGL